jgi:hypothetical protein
MSNSRGKRHIEELKLKLVDLTRRNRLLYFKPARRSTLVVSRPEAQPVFERLVVQEKAWKFWLPPVAESEELPFTDDDEHTNEKIVEPENIRQDELVCKEQSRERLERILKNLYRRATADYQERGVRILYVVFGTLTWKEVQTSDAVRSPLILVPVELSRESARDPFSLSLAEEAEVVINPALQVKLRSDFRIELPPLPEDLEGFNLANYFDSVTNAGGQLNWSVSPEVLIGLFSFHKLVMFQDLNTNENLIAKHPLVCALGGEPLGDDLLIDGLPDESQLDKVQKPDRTFQILDADSSQQVCVQYALQGQSFVIQGPPGTGKSQTIANIIAESIAAGHTVLFVSEKMAALEVVYKRLRAVGLGDFCLELHSHKANKREVVTELKRCLEEHHIPQKSLSALDFEKLVQLREKLNDYVLSLHRVRSPLERSAYDVLGMLAKLDSVPLVSIDLPEPNSLAPRRVQDLYELVLRLRTVWQVVQEGVDFPWRGFTGNQFTLNLRSELATLLDQLPSSIEQLILVSAQYAEKVGLETPASFDEVGQLVKVSNLLLVSPGPYPGWLTRPDLASLVAETNHYQTLCELYRTVKTGLERCYDHTFFELPDSVVAELDNAWKQTAHFLAPCDADGILLLQQQTRLHQFVMRSQRAIDEWLQDSSVIAQGLGLPRNNFTIERVQQLVQLGLLCHSANRPDASWLDPIRIQHVQEQLPRVRADYEKYNDTKRRLLEWYDESFFGLEVDRLIEQYRGPYRTIFRWLIPSFYRDKRAIARTTHAGVVPESILEDLLTARELKRLATRLTAERDNVRNLLGGYYRSYNTNFDLIERALTVAKEAIALAVVIPVPNELVKTISLGTIPPPELRNTGNRLRESLETWEQEAQGFSRLLLEPKETPGFLQTAEDKLSERNRLRLANRLPGSDIPLQQSPLLEVRRWLCELATPLDALHRLTENVLVTCIAHPPTDYAAILAHLKELEKLKEIQSGIAAESERLRQHFGARYTGIDTNWSSVLAALDWTEQVQQLLGSAAIPNRFIELASQGATAAPLNVELTQAYEANESLLKSLEGRFDSSKSPQVMSFRQLKPEHLNQRLAQLRSRVDDLQAWVDFKTLERHFAEVGLGSFLERLQAAPPQASQLVDVFHKAVYQAWVSSIIAEDPALREFRGRHHEQLIEEFREVDRKLVLFSSNRVIEECNSRRPQHVVPAGDSEIAVLMREAHKQRRHLPIRQLTEKIPNLLLRLKPCLMMSPISVSQFLNPERLRFDLVIFDEASQICPEDAVGSIYRGTQLIVAGDNKQLPPTAFFHQAMTEEYDWEDLPDEEFAVFDSILDECSSIGLPAKMLHWHYRSKHESLIAFSNRQFYETRLITFPSIWAKHENLGVKFVHVPDGVYDRGGRRDNRREAAVVADLTFDHFRHYPDKTLGVVSFSISQMTAIDDEIEQRRRSQPEFERFFKDDRLEGFFVKNLENVQGDERDVMIFSVGYGYDQQHRMTMNFGPLNKPGGERRLNVAVTRAREKVILVSSVKAADIDLGATQAPGVLQLHRYMDYAERGEVALAITYPLGGGEPESDLEIEVANEIRRLGLDVVHQVGCSGYRIDLGVLDPVEPGRFLLGVECDGATYHSAYTARDRDRLRQQVLEELGWCRRIHRVWSPDWTLKRGTEIERLMSAIEKARQLSSQPQGPSQSAPQSSPNPIANPPTVTRRIPITSLQEGNLPGTVLYKIAELHPSTRVEPEFHLPKWRSEQCRLLARLVSAEGPVHIDYAAKRLVAAWGLERTGSRIMKTFREAMRHCQREGSLVRKGDFLWPPNLDKVSIRVPDLNVPESLREIEHIPPEEIQSAVLLIVKHTIGIKIESLLIETARLLGFDRTGPNIRSVLIKVYEKMLRDGLISKTDDSIGIGSVNA